MEKTQKELKIPVNIISALFFIVLSIVALVLMESQIRISANDVVNGRVFPTLLCWVAIGCSCLLLVPEIKKIINKEPLDYKVVTLQVEWKALIIFGIFVGFYFISSLTKLFVTGALFSTICFMLYFKCKKPSYYAITIGVTVAIWALFRFVLGIRF